jgi:hypothetical protein
MSLLGYSRESFEKVLGITEEGFYDDTESCSQCGKYDSRDNGYTYNFRYIESTGNLGVNCGCYSEFAESPEAIEAYTDSPDHAIEADAIKAHVKAKRLKFIERFVGGMTDSHRPHYFDGEPVRVSTPEKVLAELKAKYPKRSYVFSHDESGQFQTYFSVYQVRVPK